MWLPLVIALIGTGALAVGLGALGQRAAARRASGWSLASQALGLSFEPTATGEVAMRGTHGSYPIRVYEEYTRLGRSADSEASWTTVEVGPLSWLPRQALIGRARMLRLGGRLERAATGDVRFDAVVHAWGPRLQLLPLLDYDARRAILLGFDVGHVQVETQRVFVRKLGNVADPEVLSRLVRAAGAIVDGLDPEGRTSVEQLVKTVRREPVAGAREVALAQLVRRHVDEPEVRELVGLLSTSGLAARRAMALDLMGAEGIPVAEGVIRDPNADDEARERARAWLKLRGIEPGSEQAGRLSVMEEVDPDAEGRLSQAVQEGELALADD